MGFSPWGRAGRPILVTGSHRSGSTWVGQMLAAAPNVVYLHEPFGLSARRPPRVYPPFEVWWPYICGENEGEYLERVTRLVELRYPWRQELPEKRTLRQYLGTGWRTFEHWRGRKSGARPLLKESIALMSAEWLADRYGAQPLVLIRHPCAFVGSIVRMQWRFDYNEFLRQPLLMRDLLGDYEPQIRRLAATDHDLMENAAVLWNIIHDIIYKYQQKHSDWIFARQEDLASEPLEQFEALYRRLGLEWSGGARATVERHCYAGAPLKDDGQVHRLRRNSRDGAWSWRGRMAADEVERIRGMVGEVADHFYGSETWEPVAVSG